ncbi:MAG: SAM-dependent methyltransferase [Gammaproteobacteria bacterium]|nr:SAM-dependent methyltransferase [Gammaproteobacteria bacterium]
MNNIIEYEAILSILRKSPFNITNEKLFEHIFTRSTIKRICKTLEVIPQNKERMELVDIGCYAPMLSLYAELLNYKDITAVANYDWDTLSRKLEKLPQAEEVNVKVCICDIEKSNLSIKDESVDTVLLLEVLEHFSVDPMKVMLEINRILKKGGYLVLSTPNAIKSQVLINYLLAINPYKEPYNGLDANRHNRLYTPEEINLLADASGFEVEFSTTFNLNRGLSVTVANLISKAMDVLNLVRGNNYFFERGDIIIVRMKKISEIKDRYPSWLYISRDIWRNWYEKHQLD